jgi:hypothetical protein
VVVEGVGGFSQSEEKRNILAIKINTMRSFIIVLITEYH